MRDLDDCSRGIKNVRLRKSVVVHKHGCGGRTRTYDLRVMSPTSFQLLYSAIWMRSLECLSIVARRSAFVNPYCARFPDSYTYRCKFGYNMV